MVAWKVCMLVDQTAALWAEWMVEQKEQSWVGLTVALSAVLKEYGMADSKVERMVVKWGCTLVGQTAASRESTMAVL
jgi:hypothetical protein